MRKSILIAFAFSTLALAACATPYDDGYSAAYDNYYSSGVRTSVHVGFSDYYYVPPGYWGQPAYYYGYRSRVFRPGFYYHRGYYYPSRTPYYRNYHRNFSRWHDWDRHRPKSHWAGKPRAGKSWRPLDRDRRDHVKSHRDRRHEARSGRDRERKSWNRGNRNQGAARPGLEPRNRSHGGRLERNR